MALPPKRTSRPLGATPIGRRLNPGPPPTDMNQVMAELAQQPSVGRGGGTGGGGGSGPGGGADIFLIKGSDQVTNPTENDWATDSALSSMSLVGGVTYNLTMGLYVSSGGGTTQDIQFRWNVQANSPEPFSTHYLIGIGIVQTSQAGVPRFRPTFTPHGVADFDWSDFDTEVASGITYLMMRGRLVPAANVTLSLQHSANVTQSPDELVALKAGSYVLLEVAA